MSPLSPCPPCPPCPPSSARRIRPYGDKSLASAPRPPSSACRILIRPYGDMSLASAPRPPCPPSPACRIRIRPYGDMSLASAPRPPYPPSSARRVRPYRMQRCWTGVGEGGRTGGPGGGDTPCMCTNGIWSKTGHPRQKRENRTISSLMTHPTNTPGGRSGGETPPAHV